LSRSASTTCHRALLALALLAGGCQRREAAPTAQAEAKGLSTNETSPMKAAPKHGGWKGSPKNARWKRSSRESDRDQDGTVMRAGVRRLEAYHPTNHDVTFEGDPSVRLDAVDRACGGRRLAATVGPFVQRDRADEASGRQADVAQGGQIVTRAVGQQLATLGWIVELRLADVDSRAKVSPSGQKADLAQVQKWLARFIFTGDVAFWVSMEPTRATLEATVSVLDARHKQVFTARVQSSQVVTRQTEPGLARRMKRAKQEALDGFIRSLFASPALTRALVREIQTTRAKAGTNR